MNRLSARLRIVIGQLCLLTSVLLLATALGIVPDRHSAVLEGRGALCEAIAINGSALVSQSDTRRLEKVLEAIVQRNPEILSAGLRRASGELVIEVGYHTGHWPETFDDRAIESYVVVPIWSAEERWGSVEVRFRPLRQAGALGLIQAPETKLVAFVSSVCFLLYWLYLKRMLQHLDPSRVVPQRVRSALDTLTEGLLLMDKKERIVLANQAFARYVHEPPERLQGRCASTLPWATNGKRESRSYPWLQVIDEKSTRRAATLRLGIEPGASRTFIVNSSPVLADGGDFRGVLATFEDVTPLEEKREQLRESKEAAETANRAKSDFLARMSHEIRTPMNAILGFTDVLRRGMEESETERQEYLNRVHSSGQHLLDLINDILDLSRIESGRLQIELSRCSPHQLISEVVSFLRGRARDKGITLDYSPAAPMPETILTDPVRLRQILVNLAGNAIKFTDFGSIRIAPRLQSPAVEPRLVIDVIDTGIGIHPDDIDRIFDPFAQADSSDARRCQGTGLGLSISRQFAEALGGSIAVESKLYKGSVFTVTVSTGSLEGVRVLDPEECRLVSAPSSEDAPPLMLPRARILVVDDGESNRRLADLVLRRAGAEVEMAENGAIGVEMGKDGEYDLIFMDMQMPVMDGYAAATELREHGVTAPIIALTAHAMEGDERKCRAAGCSGFLTKPIDMDLLLQTAANELGAFELYPLARTSVSTPEVEGSSLVSSLPTDDPEFAEIVEEFLERLHEKLDAMETALAEKNFRELADLSHWLRGSGASAGFSAFTTPAAELELLARAERLDRIESAIVRLRDLEERIVLRESTS